MLKPGTIVTTYIAEYGERVRAGLLSVSGNNAQVLVPNGTRFTVAVASLSPTQAAPVAPLRPDDIIILPELSHDEYEVLTVGETLELRHHQSGGKCVVLSGVYLLLRRRADVADIYADFRLPVPKPARAVSLFEAPR